MHLWRPCNYSNTQSHTGPVGQLFVSRLGGQRFTSQGCTHLHFWNWNSAVSVVLLHWWSQRDWSLALPWALCWHWEAPLRFAPTMWKASCDHTLPSPVLFYSLQVLLLLATQWLLRARSSCWEGGEGALQRPGNYSNTQSHWSSGSIVCFPSNGSAVHVPGMHPLTLLELGFCC